MARKGLAIKLKQPGRPQPPKRTFDALIDTSSPSSDGDSRPQKRTCRETDINTIPNDNKRNQQLEEQLFGPHEQEPRKFTLLLDFPREIRDMVYRHALESVTTQPRPRLPSVYQLRREFKRLDDIHQLEMNRAGTSHYAQQKAMREHAWERDQLNGRIRRLPTLLDLNLFFVNKQVSQEALEAFYRHMPIYLALSDRNLTECELTALKQAHHLYVNYDCLMFRSSETAPWGPALRQTLEMRTNIHTFIFSGPSRYGFSWEDAQKVLDGLPRVAVKKTYQITWLADGYAADLGKNKPEWKEFFDVKTRLEGGLGCEEETTSGCT